MNNGKDLRAYNDYIEAFFQERDFQYKTLISLPDWLYICEHVDIGNIFSPNVGFLFAQKMVLNNSNGCPIA